MTDRHSFDEKLEQLHHENQSWLRSLDFFKQENAYLKNRLAQAVDKSSDKPFLALAEHFQNQFIIKDDLIDQLKHDINKMERKIREHYTKPGDGIREDQFFEKQHVISDQIQYLEKDFAQLRNEFNHYLSKNF